MSACSRNRGLVVPPSYCAAMATQADTYSTAAWDEDGAGNGATETVPPLTEAASDLAWSQPTVQMLSALLIARQRADGWVILDLQQMLRTAHLVCQKFRQGESAQQANQELASMPGPGRGDMQMALSFSSNVLLSYAEC